MALRTFYVNDPITDIHTCDLNSDIVFAYRLLNIVLKAAITELTPRVINTSQHFDRAQHIQTISVFFLALLNRIYLTLSRYLGYIYDEYINTNIHISIL